MLESFKGDADVDGNPKLLLLDPEFPIAFCQRGVTCGETDPLVCRINGLAL